MSPNSVRVPRPGPFGTVTREKLGRTSWTNGSNVNLGIRGRITRVIKRLACAWVPKLVGE